MNRIIIPFILIVIIFSSCQEDLTLQDYVNEIQSETDLSESISANQVDPNWANAKQNMLKTSNGVKNVFLDTEENNYREELAILVSKAISNEEFRALLKEKALEQFDGDYDILFKHILNEKMSNDISIKKLLKNNGDSEIIEALENKKNIQLSIPVNCENWDEKNIIPLVTYIPDGYNECLFDSIKAFKSDGSYMWISSIIPPKEPVIVVGYSERVKETGEFESSIQPYSYSYIIPTMQVAGETVPDAPSELTATNYEANIVELYWTDNSADDKQESGFSVYTRSSYTDWEWNWKVGCSTNDNDALINYNEGTTTGLHYYKVNAYNNAGTSSWSNIISTCISDWRYAGKNEQVHTIKFTDLSSVESWINGKPELRLKVYSKSGTLIHEGYRSPVRSDVDNAWYTWNHNMINWWPNDIGKTFTMNWVEEDGGSTTTISVPIYDEDGTKLMDVSQTVKDDDDVLGTSAVFWCDSESHEYNLGVFRWTHNQNDDIN